LLARSRDGGASWDTKWLSDELTTPMCQSAILHCEDLAKTFHLGPADTTSRAHLTLWSSMDKGRSWQIEQEVFEGSAAYSDMVYLGSGRMGVFYERHDYEEIVFEEIILK
jgi:sialidase-1